MKHEMYLNPTAFQDIEEGRKTIELRLYDEKRRKVNLNDNITFLKRPDGAETLQTQVIGLSIFNSFNDLFQVISKMDCGYSEETTLAEQLNNMHNYYSPEDEKKFGVIGIHIKTI